MAYIFRLGPSTGSPSNMSNKFLLGRTEKLWTSNKQNRLGCNIKCRTDLKITNKITSEKCLVRMRSNFAVVQLSRASCLNALDICTDRNHMSPLICYTFNDASFEWIVLECHISFRTGTQPIFLSCLMYAEQIHLDSALRLVDALLGWSR